MLPTRPFLLLSVCFLAASSAWADAVAYVDCARHPDSVQVYSKPRQSQQDLATSIPCGERFAVLVNGFIFSRIETSDGKIGYVLSSLISVDASASSVEQANAARGIRSAPRAPATPAPAAAPQPAAVTTAAPQPQGTPAGSPPVPAQKLVQMQLAGAPATPVVAASSASVSAPTSPPAAPATQSAPAVMDSASRAQASPGAAMSREPSPTLPTPPPPAEPPTPATEPQRTPSMLTPPPPASAAPASSAARPAPAAASEPEPRSAPVGDASIRSSWEKPVPGARSISLLEFFGGFSLARFNGGGASNNLMGGLGSFGINLTPWIQMTGDSSYNLVTVSGTKNVLYGNHFGPRVFYRRKNRWNLTPFGEALIGGSRLDTTASGVGGSHTSSNCLSFKVGGGVDLRASRHFEIRVLDFDYYRTSFGSNLHQNNYGVSVGVVLRLLGGPTR